MASTFKFKSLSVKDGILRLTCGSEDADPPPLTKALTAMGGPMKTRVETLIADLEKIFNTNYDNKAAQLDDQIAASEAALTALKAERAAVG